MCVELVKYGDTLYREHLNKKGAEETVVDWLLGRFPA